MKKTNKKENRQIGDSLVECNVYEKEVIKRVVNVTREELVQRKTELQAMIVEVDAEIAEIDALG